MEKITTETAVQQHTRLWRNIADYHRRGFSVPETASVFEVSTRTVYRTLKRRDTSGRIRPALKPGPRRGTVRCITPPDKLQLVCDFKRDNPHKGHEYCHFWLKRQGKFPPAPVTIWRIWRRYNLLATKRRRQRRREWLELQRAPGYFQLDTLYLPGGRFAFVAIDTGTRWAQLQIAERRDSKTAAMFLAGLVKAYPGVVRGVQTDNGGEFKGAFSKAVREHGLKQHYAWVSCPDQNGMVERLNRTIREESKLGAATPTTPFAELAHAAAEFELYYNTVRLHSRLSWTPPIEYLLQHLSQSAKA